MSLTVGVVIRDGHQVLLTEREDFEVWCIPGGQIEPGESACEAAVRETKEETGLDTRIDRLVGLYTRPEWPYGTHSVVVTAHVVGGYISPQQEEVARLLWHHIDRLPSAMWAGNRQRILDAFSTKTGPILRVQDVKWPFSDIRTRRELYDRRDASGMSRRDFYLLHFSDPENEPGRIELR